MKIFDFEMGPFFQIVNLIEDENEFAQYPIIETGIINDTIEDVFDNVIVVKNLDVIENKNVEVAAVSSCCCLKAQASIAFWCARGRQPGLASVSSAA